MISEKTFLKYQLEMERRFSALERKISDLKEILSSQELRHRLEMQRLEMSIAHEKEIEKAKAEAVAPKMETEEEKRKREDEERVATVMQMYSEDPETLRKLGFSIPGGGGMNG
jgi:hypothetical protein